MRQTSEITFMDFFFIARAAVFKYYSLFNNYCNFPFSKGIVSSIHHFLYNHRINNASLSLKFPFPGVSCFELVNTSGEVHVKRVIFCAQHIMNV